MHRVEELEENADCIPSVFTGIKTNMLLIIFLGLFAKLALVSGDNDTGTQEVTNFDFYKFADSRNWYLSLYTPNFLDTELDCVVINYARPVGKTSVITVSAQNTSAGIPLTFPGLATNWTRTGQWDEVYPPPSFSGRSTIVAVDYSRYYIQEFYVFGFDQTVVYVGYRRRNPDKATVDRVRQKLQKNNIDINQLAKWPNTNCQQREPLVE